MLFIGVMPLQQAMRISVVTLAYKLSTEAILDCQAIVELFERAPIPLTLANFHQPDMPLVLVNEPFLELTGYDPAAVLGQNCRFLQGNQDNVGELNKLNSAISEREDVCVTLKNERKDGSPFLNRLFLFPIFSVDQQVRFYLGTQFEVGKSYDAWSLNFHLKTLQDTIQQTSESFSWEFKAIPSVKSSAQEIDDRAINPQLQLSLALKSITQLRALETTYH